MGALKYFSLFIVVAFASLSATISASVHRRYHSPEMQSVTNAIHTMYNKGYIAMSAFTVGMQDHLSEWSERYDVTGFTIFAPINSAFISDISGNVVIPSDEKLYLHCSPVRYNSLFALRFKTEIPTVSHKYNLIVTSGLLDYDISICNVKISSPPIYDDGYVIVYSIGQLFSFSSAKDIVAAYRNSSSYRVIHAEL
ncbi:putative fasciclin-like arabinogalactan protein 20 [Capsicum chacoense]